MLLCSQIGGDTKWNQVSFVRNNAINQNSGQGEALYSLIQIITDSVKQFFGLFDLLYFPAIKKRLITQIREMQRIVSQMETLGTRVFMQQFTMYVEDE